VIIVDARGLRCPLPIIRAAQAARDAAPGTVLEVISTDPAAEPDVAAWCRMRGHELLGQEHLPAGEMRHRIRVGPG
jgi:tRNA 2-thiouridine synthesizing protein A